MVLNGLGNGIFNVLIQLYLISLGFTGTQLGSVFMWSSIGQLILTIPAGMLADRYGMKRIITLGFAINVVTMIMLLSSKTLFMFSLSWLLLGIGNSTGSLFGPLFSSLFDHDDLDQAFGLQGSINIGSNAVGSLFGLIPPILVSNVGLSLSRAYWVMLAVGVLFFGAQMPLFLSVLNTTELPSHSRDKKTTLKSKGVVAKFAFLYTIQNLAYGSFFGLFPFYVNTKYGVESDALGILYSVVQVVRAVMNMIAPKIATRYGTIRTVSTALATTVPLWLLFTVAPTFQWVFVVYLVRMAAGSICNPLMPSLFYRILYEDEKATANSITQTASMVKTGGPHDGEHPHRVNRSHGCRTLRAVLRVLLLTSKDRDS
jgi:MFS family permease